MSKIEVSKEINQLLTLLTIGSRKEIKEAKKTIEKLWYTDRKLFKKCAPIVFEYLAKFDQIKNIDNQKGFIAGISLFYLALSDDYFEILKNFTLKTLQHPHGHVRETMRKTADWLYISLTDRADPFVYPKGEKLNQKQKINQEIAKKQYITFVKELEFLIQEYDDGVEQVEYIDEMKPSVNKSLQLFWSRLTETRAYRKIIEEIHPVSYEILDKREEIEQKLSQLLEQIHSEFSIEDIKEIIYYENGQDAFNEILKIVNKQETISEMNNLIKILNDSWNYFPHKILNGLSPIEKLLENGQRLEKKNNLSN